MAKKQPKKKWTDSLNTIKIALIQSQDPAIFLYQVKSQSPSNLFNETIYWILNQPRVLNKIFPDFFPKDYGGMMVKSPLGTTNIKRDLQWASALLRNFSKEINDFVFLKVQYENSYLNNNWKECEAILSKIENAFGVSFWLLKRKINLLQVSQGLEAQKRFTTEVRKYRKDSPVSFIAFYTSYCNEEAVSTWSYLEQIRKQVSDLNISSDIKNFLNYHLAPMFVSSQKEIQDIICFESSASLIDYYETFLTCNRYIHLLEVSSSQNIIALENISLINDVRLKRLIDFNKNNLATLVESESSIRSYENLIKGNWQNAVDFGIDDLESYPANFFNYEIIARALSAESVTINGETFYHNLINHLQNLIELNDNCWNSSEYLGKVGLLFYGDHWADFIFAQAFKHSSDDITLFLYEYLKFALIADNQLHPLRVQHDFKNISKYSEFLTRLKPEVVAHIENDNNFNYQDSIIKEERLLINTFRAYLESDFLKCIKNAKILIQSTLKYYQNIGVIILANSLFKTDNLKEAIKLIVSEYLNNDNLYSVLPIKVLVEKIDDYGREKLCDNIEVPIIYDIYSRFFSREIDYLRAYSFEDFLGFYNLLKPSELIDIKDNFNLSKIIYFFRYVCIEPVMDGSPVYNGSQDIAEERLKICKLLVEIDPPNIDIYQSEIKDLLRLMMIKKRIKEIEQSKIYVDIESLKQFAEKTLREKFNRYISFLKNNVDEGQDLATEKIFESASKRDIQGLLSIPLPENEVNSLLERLVLEIRDMFVSNSEHGLDGYLSVKVRHGSLSVQLRSFLLALNLITQKDSKLNKYKENKFWKDKLDLGSHACEPEFDTVFENFSKAFDDLTEKVVNEWMQIKRKETDLGLFNFIMVKQEFPIIRLNINESMTLSEFIDNIIEHLFFRLELSLKDIRETFDIEVKTKINLLLTELHGSLISLGNKFDIDLGDLILAISHSRVDMQVVLDRIKNWFRLTQTSANEPFSFEDAVDISVASLNTSAHNFITRSTKSSLPLSDWLFPGPLLPTIVDILFIIFENIIRHSALTEPSASVEVVYDGTMVFLKVENDLGETINIDELKNKISDTKNTISSDKYYKLVSKEGGTGFYKIRKLLLHDFKFVDSHINTNIEFGINDNNKFFVEIGMSANLLSKTEEIYEYINS